MATKYLLEVLAISFLGSFGPCSVYGTKELNIHELAAIKSVEQ